MAKEEKIIEKKIIIKEKLRDGGGGMVYCLGIIGALVYYLQRAETLNEVLLGIVKSLLWPAFVLHRILQVLGM